MGSTIARFLSAFALASTCLSLVGCGTQKEEDAGSRQLLLQSSVTSTGDSVGFVHVLGKNIGATNLSWSVVDARLVAPKGSACEQARDRLLALEEPHGVDVAREFSLGLFAFSSGGEWQVRSLGLPKALFGKGCSLTLIVDDSARSLGQPKSSLTVDLKEGAYDAIPDDLLSPHMLHTGPTAQVEFVDELQTYLVRVVIRATDDGLLRVTWPSKARCSNGDVSLALTQAVPSLLPTFGAQHLVEGQWTSAAVALTTSQRIDSTSGVCQAPVMVEYEKNGLGRRDEFSLSIDLSTARHISASQLSWTGCLGCVASILKP